MVTRRIRIRKKLNWLQIYWRPNGSSCEFEKMFALGWTKFPEDISSCRFFENVRTEGPEVGELDLESLGWVMNGANIFMFRIKDLEKK